MWSLELTLNWVWSSLLIALHLAVMVHILISKHENPQQSTFWLLLVAFVPVLGVIFYLVFGITRLHHVSEVVLSLKDTLSGETSSTGRNFDRVRRELAEFRVPSETAGSPRMRTLDRLFPENPALTGNHMEMLRDGTAVYPRMLADIRKAKHCIRMQSFILNSDEVGRTFMAALEERAAAGVDVKVLFDSFGSFKSYFSRYFRRCLFARQKNFQIRAFSPVNLFAPWKFQLRNHRKLLIVDSQVAYVGGVNISEENERLKRVPPSRYIHDLHCRITGPAVAQFTFSFFHDWVYTQRRRWRECTVPEDFPAPVKTVTAILRVLPSGPGNIFEGTRQLFFSAAALAEKELWILTPYLVPGGDYIDALCMAAARGVSVRVVVPAVNNHFLVDCAAHNYYRKLLDSGVVIYEKIGIFSHAKALLVDSEWGFMGSSNCDSRSFRLNFELDFCFEGSDFVPELCRQFVREFAGSRKLTHARLTRRKLWRKLLEYISALFTPIL